MTCNDNLMISFINSYSLLINFSRRDNQGNNLLHYACYFGNIEKIIFLINEHSIPLNSLNNSGKTPLMFACIAGKIDAVKFMCSKYVDINFSDNNGMTPVLHAYKNGYYDIVRYLINDCNCDCTYVANDGFNLPSNNSIYNVLSSPNILNNNIFTSFPSSPPRQRLRRARRVLNTSPIHLSNTRNSSFHTPARSIRTNSVRRNLNVNSNESAKKCVIPQFVQNDYIECMIKSKKACAICMEEYNLDCGVKILDCGHSLCKSCFEKNGTNCFMRC